MRTQFLLPVIGTVAILTAGMASAQTYSTIDVPGGFYTVAEGINDRSEIVGVFRVTGDTYHGFLRSKGQFTTIDGPNAEHTFALGINNRTQIVGWLR